MDAEKAGQAVDKMVSQATNSFLNGRRIFQIDGNLGATAGIAEALLQSHLGIIHLLPALPPSWREGSVHGLAARDGITVDIQWADGRLTAASLTPARSGSIEVRSTETLRVEQNGQPIASEKTEYGFRFQAEPGKTYQLCRLK